MAFVVAGANRDGLLSDLHGAVQSAIDDGTTIATFRSRFDDIVNRHGWGYNGGRNWRTRVIYDTNLRTSYAAGRFDQLQAGKARRPFWRYRHSHASSDPREQHLAWDGLILDADDSWWETHYPPNGWGCKCFVESLSARDLKRLGREGADKAPAVKWRTVMVGQQSPVKRIVTVPQGIDPGFAYAPGRVQPAVAAIEHRLAQASKLEPIIAAEGVGKMLEHAPSMAKQLARWRAWNEASGYGGDRFDLGAVEAFVVEWLLREKGIDMATAVISITREDKKHARREGKKAPISQEDWDNLPAIVQGKKQTYYQRHRNKDYLVLVYTPLNPDEARSGKIAVRVNFKRKSDKKEVLGNDVKTASYEPVENISIEKGFELITRGLE